jgi:transposase
MSRPTDHVGKAVEAARQVEYHRGQMAHYSIVRARNIARAVEADGLSREEVAEALDVSVSTINKAIAVARDPEGGRARWSKKRKTEER